MILVLHVANSGTEILIPQEAISQIGTHEPYNEKSFTKNLAQVQELADMRIKEAPEDFRDSMVEHEAEIQPRKPVTYIQKIDGHEVEVMEDFATIKKTFSHLLVNP